MKIYRSKEREKKLRIRLLNIYVLYVRILEDFFFYHQQKKKEKKKKKDVEKIEEY